MAGVSFRVHHMSRNSANWLKGINMKLNGVRMLGCVAGLGVMMAVGCRGKTETAETKPAGLAVQTGAAVEHAVRTTLDVATNVAEKTSTAAEAAAAATKDAAGQAVEKTGQTMEKAGAVVEKAGADMQK